MTAIPIIGTKPKDNDASILLKRVLKLAREGKIDSVAIVMTDGKGGFRVTAAGDNIDGLRDGSVELFKQLDGLLDVADAIPAPKPVILNG